MVQPMHGVPLENDLNIVSTQTLEAVTKQLGSYKSFLHIIKWKTCSNLEHVSLSLIFFFMLWQLGGECPCKMSQHSSKRPGWLWNFSCFPLHGGCAFFRAFCRWWVAVKWDGVCLCDFRWEDANDDSEDAFWLSYPLVRSSPALVVTFECKLLTLHFTGENELLILSLGSRGHSEKLKTHFK